MTEDDVREMLKYDADTVVETMRQWGYLTTNNDLSKQRMQSILSSMGWFPSAGSVPYDVVLRAMQQYAASEHKDVMTLIETCAASAVTIRGLVALSKIKFGNLDSDANMIFDAALKQAEALSTLKETQN